MQFSRPMIELVYALRRAVPAEMKPAVKLANPSLFEELAELYHSHPPVVTQALIKELFALAGDPWLKLLVSASAESQPAQVKVYRGQVSHEALASKQTEVKSKPKRVYRGQVIS